MLNYSVEDLMNVIRKSQSGNSYVGENPDKKGQTDRDMTKDVMALLKQNGRITENDLGRIQHEYNHNDITPGWTDQQFANSLNQAYKKQGAVSQNTDNQSADNQSADNQSTDNQSTDNQNTDNQSADNQSADNQPNTPEDMEQKPDDTTQGKQVANTNTGVAGAEPGDYIIRSNGQKYFLTAGDITWAKGKVTPKTETSEHNAEREQDQGQGVYNGGDESPDTSNMDQNVTAAGAGLTKNGAKPMTMGIGKAKRYFADGKEVDKATYEVALAKWKKDHPNRLGQALFPDRSQEREDLYKYGAR